MSDQVDHGAVSASPARGIAAQVVANTSLLIGILVYMGWSYEDAFFGYFNISPLDFDVGVLEYMLRSLSLFSPALVIMAAALIFVIAVRTWGVDRTRWARLVDGWVTSRILAVVPFFRSVPADAAEQPAGRPGVADRHRGCRNGHRLCHGLDRQLRSDQHV